jgi:hypothetical protein
MCDELLMNFQKLSDHPNALMLMVDAFNCPLSWATCAGEPAGSTDQAQMGMPCLFQRAVPQNGKVFHADNMVDYGRLSFSQANPS